MTPALVEVVRNIRNVAELEKNVGGDELRPYANITQKEEHNKTTTSTLDTKEPKFNLPFFLYR